VSDLRLREVHVAGRSRPRLAVDALTLEGGQLTAIVGPNGAGKSTLIRFLAGLDKGRGQVLAEDVDLRRLSPRRRAAQIAWLPQRPTMEEGLLAEEVVAAARYRHREPWARALVAARDALRALRADPLAQRAMTSLSGGEAQRVRLASLVAQDAAWWLLDEPGNHLDPSVRLELVDVVAERVQGGGSVVLVTHDLALLAHLPACRVIALQDGLVAEDLSSRAPDLPEKLGAIFGIGLAWVQVEGEQRLVVQGARP